MAKQRFWLGVMVLWLVGCQAQMAQSQLLPQAGWERSNPGAGGAFNTIGAGPTGVLLAGSDLSGAYRSLDEGQSWEPIGAAHGLTQVHIDSVAFDPEDENILYLGAANGIFRSSDKGETVTQVLEDGYVPAMAMAPSEPEVGYAAVQVPPFWESLDGEVFKTVDRGVSWQRVSVDLPEELRIVKLLVRPDDADVVYVLGGKARFACSASVLYRSVDGGVHWERVGTAVNQIMDVAISPANPDILYATNYGDVWDEGYNPCVVDDLDGGKLYRSEDRGDSWTAVSGRNGSLWLDAADSNIVRLIDLDNQVVWRPAQSGIWETRDGGGTWQKVSGVEDWDDGWWEGDWVFGANFDGAAHTLGEDLSDPSRLLWAVGHIFVVEENGRLVTPLYTDEVASGQWRGRGVDNVVMFDISISPANSDDIYLGYYDIGCWHSPNGGESWQNCNHYETGEWPNATAVLADPSRVGVVWSAQAPDTSDPFVLLRSDDYGQSWVEANVGLPAGPISGLSVDGHSSADQRTLLVTADQDVYGSWDDGWQWEKWFDCGGCWFTAVDQINGQIVYAGGQAGLFRSTQGGAPGSWEGVGLPQFVGRDAGTPWFPDGWEPWTGVHAIRTDPVREGWVYVAVDAEGEASPVGGLYRSRDAGQSWELLLADGFMRDVAISPADPHVLYATSSGSFCCGSDPTGSHGVLRSVDGGETWTAVNEGMAWPFAHRIALVPDEPDWVWVGSPGTGFQRRWFGERPLWRLFLPLVMN